MAIRINDLYINKLQHIKTLYNVEIIVVMELFIDGQGTTTKHFINFSTKFQFPKIYVQNMSGLPCELSEDLVM